MDIPKNAELLIRVSPLKGLSCSFIKINDEWGIKAYRSEDQRDSAFNNQIKFEREGFAPTAGECFRIGQYYCYSTMIAEILIDPFACGSEWDITEEEHSREINRTINKMEAVGLHPEDCHAANFGIFNGNMVFIDFGF